MRSGFCALILSTTLLKSRVGVGCGMVSRISKPLGGSCAFRSLARPEPNSESSCTIITVFAGLPAASLIAVRFSSAVLATIAETRAEAERVLETAGDDAVGDPNVDDIGQIITGGGLGGGKTDRGGIAADDAGDARRVHLFHFGSAAVGRRLRVTKHRIEFAPSALMPPAALMSSTAMVAPRRLCWPE